MNIHLAVFALSSAVCSVSLSSGADLSRYRDFQLGMSLADVAKQTGIALSAAQLVSSRPERIEELDWRTSSTLTSPTRADSVKEVLFSFYNGELFEMAITYDQDQVAGLTDADMVEAISGIYGRSAKPAAAEMTFNSGYSKTVRVIAQWQDARNLLSLVGFPYDEGFGMVVSSKSSEILAQRAIRESERLDHVEAPEREIALKAKQLAEKQAVDEKSRLVNKPVFRP